MTPLPYAADDLLPAGLLRSAGFGSHAVAGLVRQGVLHHLCRGWYSTRTPTTPEDRHLLLARAVLRHLDGRAVLSHFSVVLATGLPTWRADLRRVHVTRVSDEVTRRRPHLVSHARLRGVEVSTIPGLGRAVPLAVAIAQTGLVAGPMEAVIIADAALHRGLVTTPALEEAVRLLAGRRGLPGTAAALARSDGRRESVGETRLGCLMAELGIAVTPQFPVRTRLGERRADFRIDGTRVLLEMDGKVKYTDPLRRGDVLWSEKRRQEAIEEEGWIVVRISWTELDDPAALFARIRAALRRSGRVQS